MDITLIFQLTSLEVANLFSAAVKSVLIIQDGTAIVAILNGEERRFL